MTPEFKKRETAHKLKIGQVLNGNPIIEQTEAGISEGGAKERLKFLELSSQQQNNQPIHVQRVNIIANIIDKFMSEGEKRFATLTIDDASGQIRIKVFGEDTAKFQDLNQGDTVVVIGFLRSYNNELYILPEVIKKIDPRYLLVRKLEIENKQPKPTTPEQTTTSNQTKDRVLTLIKSAESKEGIDTEQIILQLKDSPPDTINQEITKLIADGVVYEPRPGRVRYLG